MEVINRDRASIIAGIKRVSVRQRELAERIREARATVEQNAGAAAANDDLTAQLNWSIRIFDEREKSMNYLCEPPVLLEQRAFALGRTTNFLVEDLGRPGGAAFCFLPSPSPSPPLRPPNR